ncbi:MAG: cation diffusion facilitator family transporter [Acidimicrobiia bacterium]|jgi:cobalt-zinc-cadmium efflux system protein
MSHDHGHTHGGPSAHGAGARYRGRLQVAFVVIALFFVAQLVVAVTTGSLALLSDAGHMLTDTVGLGLALVAIVVAGRAGRDRGRTYGLYRLEVLAALANAFLLVAVAVYVIVEAILRIGEHPDVPGTPVLVMGCVGLAVNLGVLLLLREGSRESMNVRGAYLEVFADSLGSLGVIVAAVVLIVFSWEPIDAIIGVAIGLFMVPRALRLAWDALRVLSQIAPAHVDVDALTADLGTIPGVVDVHDVHVWTLTSAMDVATAHLMVGTATDHHTVLDDARTLLRSRYGIEHATLQVEPEDHEGCEDVTW